MEEGTGAARAGTTAAGNVVTASNAIRACVAGRRWSGLGVSQATGNGEGLRGLTQTVYTIEGKRQVVSRQWVGTAEWAGWGGLAAWA